MWALIHQWWDSFLANPQATFSAWIGFASTALGIYLQHIKSRNASTLKRMQSIPPTQLPETFVREVTGKHAALDARLAAIEMDVRMARDRWSVEELREVIAEKDREMAEIVKDASKTGAALAASEEHRNQLIADLDRTRAEKASYKLAYEAELAKNATLQNAIADSDARLVIKQRELDACERRAGAIALELHDRKHEAASGHDHSVELALLPDPEATITPLRPPALPKGRP